MRNIIKTLFVLGLLPQLFCSCAEQCSIAGNSTVGSLDGQMLYLRITQNGTLTCDLDSCEVVHGRFSFYNRVDSAIMAMLCMGEESLMPLVLENGTISVEVDHVGQRITGGPLNEKLYHFLQKRDQLENQKWELDRKYIKLMHEGHSIEDINQLLGPRSARLTKAAEDLETNFIIDNFDNPLASGCFMWIFSKYTMPVMTEQIKRIVNVAPSHFLNDPYVHNYLIRAKMHMAQESE